jgi:hypothetical protein
MDTLRTLLASLGTSGAVRNAEHAILARQAEERAMTAFTDRMAALDSRTLVAPAA